MNTIPILSEILLLTLAAPAPTPIYQAVVILPEAEVRCQPGTGPHSYPTNHLHRNDPVQVVSELRDGWLVILPPPGSFSWINKREVTNEAFPNHPNNWVVKPGGRKNGCPVFIGSDVTPGTRGTVVGVHLQAGYQMPCAFGRSEVNDHEGVWLPIEAPIGEVRYLRSDAVHKTGPAIVAGTPSPASGSRNAITMYTASASPASFPPPTGTPADQVWLRARQAETSGNVNEAIQLYSQLASQTSGSAHDQAMQGLNRAYWLREAQRNSSMQVVPAPPFHTVQAIPVSQSATPPLYLRASGGTEAFSSFSQHTSASGSATPWQAVTSEGYLSSGPGRLRRAGRMVDGQRGYVLDSIQNYPMLYCTPHTGIDLEAYLNQNVELIGPAIYRGDLRANYMTVVRIQPIP